MGEGDICIPLAFGSRYLSTLRRLLLVQPYPPYPPASLPRANEQTNESTNLPTFLSSSSLPHETQTSKEKEIHSSEYDYLYPRTINPQNRGKPNRIKLFYLGLGRAGEILAYTTYEKEQNFDGKQGRARARIGEDWGGLYISELN